MKKFITLIVSAFSFCLFTTLLIVALATNDYGINIDKSGLFPKFDFTFLDNETDQRFGNRAWTDEVDSVQVKNQTDEDIKLYLDGNYDPNIDGYLNVDLNTFGPITVTKQGATFNINTLPYNQFDYTYVDNNLFYNNDDSYINVFSYQYTDNENYNPENISSEDTIKAGETYEIKLP